MISRKRLSRPPRPTRTLLLRQKLPVIPRQLQRLALAPPKLSQPPKQHAYADKKPDGAAIVLKPQPLHLGREVAFWGEFLQAVEQGALGGLIVVDDIAAQPEAGGVGVKSQHGGEAGGGGARDGRGGVEGVPADAGDVGFDPGVGVVVADF